MKTYYYTQKVFPIGTIGVVVSDEGLEQIFLLEVGWDVFKNRYQPIKDDTRCKEVVTQLEEYFSGNREVFDVPLAPKGTAFQRAVWQKLQCIPYGETRTYGEIAKALEKPGGARAVGSANRANPVPIVVPCHRVIGSGGKLGGYMGQYTDLKIDLLQLEKKGRKQC